MIPAYSTLVKYGNPRLAAKNVEVKELFCLNSLHEILKTL